MMSRRKISGVFSSFCRCSFRFLVLVFLVNKVQKLDYLYYFFPLIILKTLLSLLVCLASVRELCHLAASFVFAAIRLDSGNL